MASEVKTNKVSPSTGVTVTLGDASDVFQLPASAEIDIASGATLDVNGTIDVTGATTTGFPAGGMAGVQVYTAASSTWTKATRESALGITITKVIVEVQGSGGSGSASLNYGGGAGGGYAKKLVDVSSVTASTISVGTGGAAVGANGGAGITGGFSKWNDTVNTDVVGNGGGGKPNSSAKAVGGTATGGDINLQGSIPSAAFNMGTDWNAIYSQAGYGYGSGGGYGYTTYGSGAGVDGIVIVWEYQ
jgi:hypothetical protein